MDSLCGNFEFKHLGKDGSEGLGLGIGMHSVWDYSFHTGKGKDSSYTHLDASARGLTAERRKYLEEECSHLEEALAALAGADSIVLAGSIVPAHCTRALAG